MASGNYDTIRANWKCLLACVVVSMSPFQYGIDFGLIGGIQAMLGFMEVFGYKDPTTPIGWNISTERQQLISSLMTLGAVIASGLAGPIALRLGRKSCLWIACVVCAVSDILMMATTSVAGLYAGRLINGLANGLFMTFSQLYIQECSPAKYRGLMLSGFQFWTSIGTLIGTIVDNFTAKLSGKEQYLIPLGLIYIVPFFMTFALFWIPESPRWLAQTGQDAKARASLMWLRPNKQAVDGELTGIQEAIEQANQASERALFLDMFRDPVNRRRTLLAVGAVNTQAASGAMFIIAFGTYFFEMAGVGDAFTNSVALVAVGVVAVIFNSFVITRYGRRRVFLISGLLLCAAAMLIEAVAYTINPQSESVRKLIVGISVVYIFGYNGMISSYAWVSGGELPCQRLRSSTFGLAASVGFLGAWLTTFTAPYFINPASLNWGPKYGYIWVPSCLVAAAFVWFCLPEVKGRTLEEIDEMFEKRLPARRFRTYVCTGRAALESMQRNASTFELDTGPKSKGDVVETIERI
ncbi:hypothetical protein D0869_06110 [Hortaea werneckii]|uniref:Major facilitator superfamily (MFS) profile domain-containing protein n=1 Tax=Hortaea werneckii TaxID=91943 RepID=A0A3M6WUW8_HORWE|nr:MFS transporter [Hortaea werneckii]KAI7586855.1 MFS transporter [Hortaea werneckii]RMX82362.1 hypothetical protein D0869_06110 [Hortaea werneckii]RMX99131.1 hypothetical protein D0868_09705 [Hortaea werneckii]